MEKQKYQFVYWKNQHKDERKTKSKVVKAKSLEKACEKFISKMDESNLYIDYEVRLENGDFVDISEIDSVKEYVS